MTGNEVRRSHSNKEEMRVETGGSKEKKKTKKKKKKEEKLR